jgi:hemerythrin-like domain-containing protein
MWTTIATACATNKRPVGMSIKQFLNHAGEFCSVLTLHHNIEEQSFFPMLASRMTVFQHNDTMRSQHKEIHNGIDKLEAYIADCRNGKRELRLSEMQEIMDSFGSILWRHLDEEVRNLGAENMRKYWTLDEMKKFPF